MDLTIFTRRLRIQGAQPPPVGRIIEEISTALAQERTTFFNRDVIAVGGLPRSLIEAGMLLFAIDLDELR